MTVTRAFPSLLLLVAMACSCQAPPHTEVQRLNDKAYAAHYRSVDSVEHYARQALQLAQHDSDGKAKALNNLAFASIVRMDYARAERQLTEVVAFTDNQIEQLVAEVQLMRLCQRRSRNREFYEHRERALGSLRRINEERASLSSRDAQRMIYAESELAIVNSTYYYYVGLERQAAEAIQQVNEDEVRRDTAQYLNYLYNIGSGGVIINGTAEDIANEEAENLYRCVSMAERCHYPYFEANAKEALAERENDLQLAEEALTLFRQFGDVYQIAGAHRTLATCYHAVGDDRRALPHLYQALADKRINQAPDLVASIREQLSVVYAALDDKPSSDYNRNIYIDIQERTRQDRELEARAARYETVAVQLNVMIAAVLVAIVLLLFLLWLFNRLNRRQKQDTQLEDLLEQKREAVAEAQMGVERNEKQYLEQRAKVALVVSITPLIDRILHEVKRLNRAPAFHGQQSADGRQDEQKIRRERLSYIQELATQINVYNDVLTQWIQLRQGTLNLHIESFRLQDLFDIVAHSRTGFAMKQVTLEVLPTDAVVKADRVLTLFMLNTLADNARKFTDRGGRVTVSACETDACVEVVVADTGRGMDPYTLDHLFDAKPVADPCGTSAGGQRSHGFGLMNCKGIIEKYRKLSRIFSVCTLTAESRVGVGSRFAFRLPKGLLRMVVLVLLCAWSGLSVHAADNRSKAHIFADSAYFSNINGTYGRTLAFADSCMKYLNRQYLDQRKDRRLLMTLMDGRTASPPEIAWLHDSVKVNYQVILDIRNESAVAALALHDWQLYAYNNKAYTQLYKELSADNTLGDYCRKMQQSQSNKRIAVILLVIILALIVPAYYMQYYRHRLYRRFDREKQQRTDIELAEDDLRRAELERNNLYVANAVLDNCLSALKHETMYYPDRIRQLAAAGDQENLAEVAGYYRELYGTLSGQALRQVERFHLHLTAVDCFGHRVLGDRHALNVLCQTLVGKDSEVAVEEKDARYWLFTVTLPQMQLTAAEAETLFTPSSPSNIPYLICRQIVRDHGEATNLRGCGIWAETVDGQTCVKLTLPKYGKL